MARFRTIELENIILRRAEASACLHHGLHHAATLTACSGIELFLEFLVSKLHNKLNHERKRQANALQRNVVDEERRNAAKVEYWGLKSWADFYRKNNIFDSLSRQFGYQFTKLNNHTLESANETWNKCKHDPYLATVDIAQRSVALLTDYLEESGFRTESNEYLNLTVGSFNRDWRHKWEKPLKSWVVANPESPQSTVLLHLEPLLDLLIRLIDDDRVTYEFKTSLMVSANYVFSTLDLIPEDEERQEVNSLVDDGAVVALTLYWLLQRNDFDREVIYSHWPGGASIIGESQELMQHIWDFHEALFPDARGQLGHKLVWKVIKRIATDGPEALWQNYWKEQSDS